MSQRHTYEIELTRRELLDIMQGVRGMAEGSTSKAKERRRKLANRIEQELWIPYLKWPEGHNP